MSSITPLQKQATSPAAQLLTDLRPGNSNFLQRKAAEKQAKTWVTWIDQEYKKAKDGRANIERQWYLNLSMYFGKQYLSFINDSNLPGNINGKLVTPPAPPWRTRLVSNKIRPIIRTELARVTSQKPNASVVPASSDDADLFAAQAGEQIWESFWANEKGQSTFRRAMWWTLICGSGFIKDWWDPNAVDPQCPDTVGKICMGPVTPFHLFVPDLREEEIEDEPFVINVYTRPVEFVKQFYSKYSDLANANADTVNSSEIMEDAYLNLQGSTHTQPDSVLCKEIWIKPGAHKDFPDGGMVTIVSNTVVYATDMGMPYKHGQYPFTKFDHIPSGKFYADSVIVDLTPLQKEYNRTRSQLVEARNRMSKPQLRAPIGSVNPAKITSEPGIVIEYRPGLAPPEPMPLQGVPNYVVQELSILQGDMEDVSSQHAVSRGETPSGLTAATAISYLQEQDDAPLSHTYQSIEEGFQKLAFQVLNLVVQYWDAEHMVKVTGTDGAFDTMVLKSSDVETGTDIRMEAGSSLPTSKAARQAFLMDLMKSGFIDPNKGLELMEIGGVQKLYDQLNVDKRQAQRENLRMKSVTGEQMDIYDQQLNAVRIQNAQQQMQQAITNPPPPDPNGQGVDGTYPDQTGPGAGQTDPNSPDGQLQAIRTGNPANAQPQNMPGQVPGQDPTQSTGIDPTQTDPGTDATTGQVLDPPLLVPVNSWDNHAIHIDTHNNFRKGQAFELLDDSAKRLFELHVQMHIQSANQAAMGMGGPPMGFSGQPSGPPQMGGGTPGPQPGGGGNQFTNALDPSMAGGQ